MLAKKKILAVIPARGGSKRLPGKNIKRLGDKPLIAWSIEAAKRSRYLEDVIVSTDSVEIALRAEQYGANIPFIRPPELARDHTSSVDVVLHALKTLQQRGEHYDYVLLLQPTSPFRTAHHIDESIEMLFEKKADAIVSVCESEHNPIWSNPLPENLSLEGFLPERYINARTQDLPTYYRLNGALYLCNTAEVIRQQRLLLNKNIYAYIMKREDSVDIDTKLDFLLAETILQHKQNHKEKNECPSI